MIRKPSRQSAPPGGRARRGAAMLIALMALLLSSLIIAALLRTAALSHRQLKREEYRIQASLLADAGYQRALLQLQNNPEWTGEEWALQEKQLAPGRTAMVRITVAADSEESGLRAVTATADYPVDHPDRVRIVRKRNIP
ncbi:MULTISPECIES: hypothetical protein [unclassified Schlesneria]|uniref:hypothetical protein n=1 Tax=Schlesneria TaxID=656899 RepID=UPI00359FE4E9